METRMDPKKSAAIDRIVARKVRAAGPGLALAVIKDGNPIHVAGYGLADLDTREPVTPRTQFHMASCGKQFTALGITMLRARGKLRYDDRIGRHIPELAGYKGVTIRRLLHHLSGVYDFYEIKPIEDELCRRASEPTNRHLVRLYADLDCPMSVTAGRFSYSNAGYDLLGSVIERISGQSYREFFRTRVFARLGMTDTYSLPARRRLAGRCVATGNLKNGRYIVQSDHRLDGICGSGSIYSTVFDLCRYEAALAADRLVSAASMRTAFRSGIQDNEKSTGYGFGWDVTDEFVEHAGEWNGYASHVRRYRDRRLSIYVLSNNTFANEDAWDYFAPKDIVEAIAKKFP